MPRGFHLNLSTTKFAHGRARCRRIGLLGSDVPVGIAVAVVPLGIDVAVGVALGIAVAVGVRVGCRITQCGKFIR
jgi:hypothetical protein